MLSRNAVETEGDRLQFLEYTYKHGYLQAMFKIRSCGTEFYLNRHATERRLYDLLEHQEPHEITDYVLSAWPKE